MERYASSTCLIGGISTLKSPASSRASLGNSLTKTAAEAESSRSEKLWEKGKWSPSMSKRNARVRARERERWILKPWRE